VLFKRNPKPQPIPYSPGISQDVKEENMLTSMSFSPSASAGRQTSVIGPPTPPGQRKSNRPFAITAPLTQRGKGCQLPSIKSVILMITNNFVFLEYLNKTQDIMV